MKKLTVSFVALLSLLATSAVTRSVARAEPNSSTSAEAGATSRARAAFARAKSLYESGQYTGSLLELKVAYALKKIPVLLRYMGDCYAKLGRPDLAVKHYANYLRKAPGADDRSKVEQTIYRLTDKKRRERFAKKRVPKHLVPSGKDAENPLKPDPSFTLRSQARDRRGRYLTVAKWAVAGASVAALATGIVFNRLAAARANDLKTAVRAGCPASAPDCGGNPDLDSPKISYSLDHYQLEQQVGRNNRIAVSSFIIAGAAAATSLVLFILDRPRGGGDGGGGRRLGLAPVVTHRSCGIAGEVTF
jgi:hypothetical protein